MKRPTVNIAPAEREYRSLMRRWWFGAAVGAPTMVLSYPWLFPVLGDWFPRDSDRLRALWMVMGAFALAVLAYSGSQFFTGAWRALRQRTANMHERQPPQAVAAEGGVRAWTSRRPR